MRLDADQTDPDEGMPSFVARCEKPGGPFGLDVNYWAAEPVGLEELDEQRYSEKMELNRTLAKEFADSLAPMRASSCGCNGADAYAVSVDRKTGFGLTATWSETPAGTEFKTWLEFTGKPSDAERIAASFKKMMEAASAI